MGNVHCQLGVCPIRRLLTKKFLDELTPPASGEIWIADTKVRGFGVRLWAAAKGGACFCIRVVDRDGRSIRRTFDPNLSRYRTAYMLKRWRLYDDANSSNLGLSLLLDDAREWAATEIAILKGRKLETSRRDLVALEEKESRNNVANWISRQRFGHLVDLVLRFGPCRGWDEKYCDRLRSAFNAFDADGLLSKTLVCDLNGKEIAEKIDSTNIGRGNIRLLRTLLNVVLENMHTLGRVHLGRIFPKYWSVKIRNDEEGEFLSGLDLQDFHNLFSEIRALEHNWRSRVCIELCFYFRSPATRIMSGTWRQVHDGMWFPYAPNERAYWMWKTERIDEVVFPCLKYAYQMAKAEGVNSDFWFPKIGCPELPISSVLRAWNASLRNIGWPQLSLARCSQEYRQTLPIKLDWDRNAFDQIKNDLSCWLPEIQS